MSVNSIKKQIMLFGGLILALFISQVYFTADPHHLTTAGLNRYEKAMEQDRIIKDLTVTLDRQHETMERLLKKPDEDSFDALEDLQDSEETLIDTLKETGGANEEWQSAYKSLTDVSKTYKKVFQALALNLKNFTKIQTAVLQESPKPIEDLLKEIKLLSLTTQEQQQIQSLSAALGRIEKSLKIITEKRLTKPENFTNIQKHMESTTKPLSQLMRLTEKKPEMQTEVERFQSLLMNYFASIHQLKNNLLERPNHTKKLDPQQKIYASFVNDLSQGLKENQKEIFEGIYQESKSIQRHALWLDVAMVVLILLFFGLLLWTVHTPLQKMAHFLRTSDPEDSTSPSFKSSLYEIQDLLEAVAELKERVSSGLKINFDTSLVEETQKIERKLEMLATSAMELSKVSSSIAKIPKMFDQKFSSIQKSNEDSRLNFRHMVECCEELKNISNTLETAIKDAPSTLSTNALTPLEECITAILKRAHEAAVESQTMSLKFNSLIRTKDDALEISKLFSKASTRVNQLARSLHEDVQELFQHIHATDTETPSEQ